MFEAEHPEIDVTYEFSSWGDYWTRVNTQVAGDAVACVMQQDYNYLTEWASRGLLLPLDDLVEAGAINVADVADAIIDSGRVSLDDMGEMTDHVYGISLGSNSQVYIIDVDAFEAAGLELPAWDWTWDDFEELAYQMYDNTGRWMIAYGPWDDNSTWSAIISSGQMPWSEDGTTFGWDDTQPVIDYFARIYRMMEYGAIPTMDMQADIASASPSHEQSPIIRSEEAIRYQWSNQVVSLVNAAGEERNFVLYPLPRIPEGRSANYLKPSMFWSITEGCETVDEAALFIDYFTNSMEANEVLFAERGVPIAPAVLEHLSAMVDDTTAAIFDFIAHVSEDASPIPPPPPAGYTDISTNVFSPMFIEPVLYGMITPEEGVTVFREEAQAILDANQ
ncbi:MAG: extracellular solute-binding protein [Anaerolineae bacterium]|nr:extracellular solute-binding protein [Anaerolineae bacterium]